MTASEINDQCETFVGKWFPALDDRDGVDFGIYIVGCLKYVGDFVVMPVGFGRIRYDLEPYRIDMKASSRLFNLKDPRQFPLA